MPLPDPFTPQRANTNGRLYPVGFADDLLERAESSTPKAQALAAVIRVDLDRLGRIVQRADAKGAALREINALTERLAELGDTVAGLDAEEAVEDVPDAEDSESHEDLDNVEDEEHIAEDADETPDEADSTDPSPELTVSRARRALIKQFAFDSGVRAWAHTNGHRVGDTGRMRNAVVEAYIAAHPEEVHAHA